MARRRPAIPRHRAKTNLCPSPVPPPSCIRRSVPALPRCPLDAWNPRHLNRGRAEQTERILRARRSRLGGQTQRRGSVRRASATIAPGRNAGRLQPFAPARSSGGEQSRARVSRTRSEPAHLPPTPARAAAFSMRGNQTSKSACRRSVAPTRFPCSFTSGAAAANRNRRAFGCASEGHPPRQARGLPDR